MLIYLRVLNSSSKKSQCVDCLKFVLKMASLEELRNINHEQLYLKLQEPEEVFNNWLAELGLLKKKQSCLKFLITGLLN